MPKIMIVAAIITIFVFVTGIFSIPQLFKDDTNDNAISNIPKPGESETDSVVSGQVTLHDYDGLSFALGEITERYAGDVYLFWTNRGLELRLNGKTVMDTLGPVDFNAVKEVPKLNAFTSNDSGIKLQIGHVYYLRLEGKYYAKLVVVSARDKSCSIIYAFQRNGSRNFN